MKEITIGHSYEASAVVTETLLAKSVGSGDVSVYATPMMIALMEEAAAKCLAEFLEEGETSVGIHLSSSHDAATPCGMKVRAVAIITASEGKKVSFQIEAFDEKERIGCGEHSRFVVLKERFEARAEAKK